MAQGKEYEHQQRSRLAHKIALWTFLLILLFFLLTEHRAHFFGALPWLLLAACPLLHLFMHGGHGKHGDNDRGANAR